MKNSRHSEKKFDDVRAAIDIGSNSVKLLIAHVDGKNVVPIVEKSEQTRLNRGLEKTGEFDIASVQGTLKVLRKYIQICIDHETVPPVIFATSAARRAGKKSLRELLLPIWKEYGLSVQVISPLQEARWAFRGVCSCTSFQDTPVLITDVGGGSAQFTIGKRSKFIWSKSCSLGAVHLLEQVFFV